MQFTLNFLQATSARESYSLVVLLGSMHVKRSAYNRSVMYHIARESCENI